MQRLPKILAQDVEANHLISRRIPVNLDVEVEPLDVLLKMHSEILPEFYSFRDLLDEGFEPLEDEPYFSFLNLKEEIAHRLLKECGFCERNCRVDRSGVKLGDCGLSVKAPVYRYGMESEPLLEISPAFTIFFSGCNFHPAFCNSPASSSPTDVGTFILPEAFSLEVRDAYDTGAKCLKFAGGEPSLHLHYIFSLLSYCQWNLPVILHTNLYTTPLTTSFLQGVFDLILVDVRFGTDACARNLAGVENYVSILQRNLQSLPPDAPYIRHTVIPGHVACCTRPWLEWLSHLENPPPFQILFNYIPPAIPSEIPELNRLLTPEEKGEVNSLFREIFGKNASSSFWR